MGVPLHIFMPYEEYAELVKLADACGESLADLSLRALRIGVCFAKKDVEFRKRQEHERSLDPMRCEYLGSYSTCKHCGRDVGPSDPENTMYHVLPVCPVRSRK